VPLVRPDGSGFFRYTTSPHLSKRGELFVKILSVAQRVGEPITLGRAVDQFLEHKRLSEGSRKVYGQVLTAFASLNDGISLIDVDREMVAAYLDGLREVKPATYNRHFACLNSFFTWCIHQEWIEDTPMRKVERRKEPRRLPRALETGLVGRILRGIADTRDRALFTLIYENGLRCQEALDIDLEEIDWAEQSIVILGKGEKERYVFFSKRVKKLLSDYWEERGRPASGPLFVTKRRAKFPMHQEVTADGYARLSYRQADTLWKQYAGDLSIHQLRHTAISERAARGWTEFELKQFSGHSSVRTLEGYITANREAQKRKAREYERRYQR